MGLKRNTVALLFTLLGLSVAMLVGVFGFWAFGERWFWSLVFYLRGPKQPVSTIKIIGIDDASIAHLEDAGILYPFPRSLYAELLDKLSEAGARIVIFDILFSTEPWDISEDEALRDAIIRAKSRGTEVVLSAVWEKSSFRPPNLGEQELAVLDDPTDTLLEADPQIAIVSALEKLSFKSREIYFRKHQGKVYYSQSALAYRILLEDEGRLDELDANPQKFGITKNLDFFINYYGPSGTIPTYQIGSFFTEVLEQVYKESVEDLPTPDLSQFKDSVVFVGSISTVDNDYFMTPYEKMFGVETNAHALNTLLTQDIIKPVDFRVTAFILILIAAACWMIVVMLRPLFSVLAFILLVLGFEAFLIGMFIYSNYLMEFTMSTTALFTTFFFTLGFRVLTEEAEKRKLRATFSRYLAPHVVKEIIENPKLAELGGMKRQVALLFADIRNYSTIAESLDPHQTVEFLNGFLSKVSDVIMENGGFVDKFVGDGLMAVFGAPVPLDNACESAVRSALKMVEIVYKESSEIMKDLPVKEFRIGIGVHFGEVVMGNVGSGKKMDYTCIGDVVNVASRIEAQTKKFMSAILISEEVYKRLSGDFKCEYIAETVVKGRKGPIRLYRVIHPDGEEITDLSRYLLDKKNAPMGELFPEA